MKNLIVKTGLALLKFVLGNAALHNALRGAAKKTTNSYDDAAVEALIKFLNDVSVNLGAK